MPGVRVLVGTRKGAFILTSSRKREKWKIDGPLFPGWEIYHMTGSPANPDRLYASQTSAWFGQVMQRSDDGGKTWERLLGGLPDGQRAIFGALTLEAWDGGYAVYAADSDRAGIAALDKAARHTKGLKTLAGKPRDLFRDPLTRFELNFDTIVLDPPRAGAQAQVEEIAASRTRHVVMIACDPKSFARDAARLVQAGFILSDLVAVDQLAWSVHIELAATFRR